MMYMQIKLMYRNSLELDLHIRHVKVTPKADERYHE